MPFSHLVVVHYHWRTGGVRRVVEMAVPAIAVEAAGSLKRVTVVSGSPPGEQPDFAGMGVEAVFVSEPCCGYLGGQRMSPVQIAAAIRRALAKAVSGFENEPTLFWLHNPALARNPILARGVAEFCKSARSALAVHHHDFWCAGRWGRWDDIVRAGCKNLDSAAGVLFGAGAVQICINGHDRALLGRQAHLLSNPLPAKLPGFGRGGKSKTSTPVWVAPTRFLRRKNLAEAVLLARWLRPEALLATTSGSCSPDEEPYAKRLRDAARAGRWNVRFGILEKSGAGGVAKLLRSAEAVVLSSVQEGFGMAFVEAASAGVPLVGRALPAVLPDLRRMGFRFPHLYRGVMVDPQLIDLEAENRRRKMLFEKVRKALPKDLRARLGRFEIRKATAIDFARLTHAGQLEVLGCDSQTAWKICRPLNPQLRKIEGLAACGNLQPTPWPAKVDGKNAEYARRFLEIASSAFRKRQRFDALAAQRRLLRAALGSDSVYPILLEP